MKISSRYQGVKQLRWRWNGSTYYGDGDFVASDTTVPRAAVRGNFEIHRFHQCAGCYAKEVQGSDEFDQTYYRQVGDGDG